MGMIRCVRGLVFVGFSFFYLLTPHNTHSSVVIGLWNFHPYFIYALTKCFVFLFSSFAIYILFLRVALTIVCEYRR